MDLLLNKLNDRQKEAVTHKEGPILILAGAGSGKTRVLVHRIAYLLQEGVHPTNILALTFTNKAAGEMKERVIKMVPQGNRLWIGTFHSAGVRILRRYANHIGFTSNFNIYDSKDQLSLIKECLKELDIDPQKTNPNAVISLISKAKNNLQDATSFYQDVRDYFSSRVSEIYSLYEKKLKEINVLDFDDLLYYTVKLFENEKEVLGYYQEKIKYLLVDEYQDTNYLQYLFVKYISQNDRNICVVGDDDQSIYNFRGADIRNILDFEKDFPEAKVVKLEENYRSSSNILEAANYIVKNNSQRKTKKLWTKNLPGETITIYKGHNENDEAIFILNEIIKQLKKNKNCAVLYRTNAQSRVIEDRLMKEGISYTVVGGMKFYERKEVKDIVSYLRVIANPADNFSMKRIVNTPRRGIGEKTLAKIHDLALTHGQTYYEALRNPDLGIILSAAVEKKLRNFAGLIDNLRIIAQELPLAELVKAVIEESGYMSALEEENSLEALSRIENLQEFLTVAESFTVASEEFEGDVLVNFLEKISLIADVDQLDINAPKVILLTLHSAKGLEFPIVFMSGMEEGVLPHQRSIVEDNLEEERRLCYVGITRAMEQLYLTYASSRTIYNQTTCSRVSRFIEELPESVLSEEIKSGAIYNESSNENFLFSHSKKISSHTIPKPTNITGKSVDSNNWQVGQQIIHKKWGVGQIKEIKKTSDDTILTTYFPQEGTKKIIASIAPIRRAE